MPRTLASSIVGSAVNFTNSPSGSSIRVTTSSAQNNLSPVSISLWFYVRSTSGTSYRLISKGAATNAYWQIFTNASDQLIFGALWNTAYPNWTIPAHTKNAWHHVVVTYVFTDTSTKPIIYLDGVSQTVTTAAAPVGTAGADDTSLYIGNRPDGARGVDGIVDEVRIYNRTLSQSDVTTLYGNGTGGDVPTGLVGIWNFDYPLDYVTAVDGSVSASNGIISNATRSIGVVNLNPANPSNARKAVT